MSGISKPRLIGWEEDGNGCWNCTSHKIQSNGYPMRRYPRTMPSSTLARFIYEECFGDIPKGMEVCHKCDNPKCINPEHLYLGTYSQNLWDRVRTGRFPNGENNGHAKFTWKDIPIIKERYRNGELQKNIAKDYKVHQSSISNIIKGKKWQGVKYAS
jgi:hypothetical protein